MKIETIRQIQVVSSAEKTNSDYPTEVEMKAKVRIALAPILIGLLTMISILLGACQAEPVQGPIGPVGPQGIPGPQGEVGPAGANADPMALLQNADFMAAVKQKLDAPEVGNLYMLAYQSSLEYVVAPEMAVPADLLAGFTPVASLVNAEFKFPDGSVVKLPVPPTDVTPWNCFPQDYSKATEDFNRSCKELQASGSLPWSTPVAGYNDGENWSCDSANGWCADDIQALNWRVEIGYEICHPAVGCLKNPNGGAVMILQINFLDSDKVWGPRNDSAVYVDSGFQGYGIMFDLSSRSNLGEDIAHIRNHWFAQLSNPQGGDNRYKGQCGDSALCNEVTYVVVARTWDRPDIGINFAHYELIDYGTWSISQ